MSIESDERKFNDIVTSASYHFSEVSKENLVKAMMKTIRECGLDDFRSVMYGIRYELKEMGYDLVFKMRYEKIKSNAGNI